MPKHKGCMTDPDHLMTHIEELIEADQDYAVRSLEAMAEIRTIWEEAKPILERSEKRNGFVLRRNDQEAMQLLCERMVKALRQKHVAQSRGDTADTTLHTQLWNLQSLLPINEGQKDCEPLPWC